MIKGDYLRVMLDFNLKRPTLKSGQNGEVCQGAVTVIQGKFFKVLYSVNINDYANMQQFKGKINKL